MTPKQEATLQAAYTELGEHFDDFLIVVASRSDDGETEAVRVLVSGSTPALGLAVRAQHQLLNDEVDEDDED